MSTQRLNAVTMGPAPIPLRYTDISTAVKSTNDAFKTDPLRRYVVETPDSNDTILHKITHNANFSATLAEFVREGTVWTIENGAALVCYTRAKESNPDGSLDTLIQWLLPYATAYRKGLLSPEQRRRYKEAEDKVHKKVEETIGTRRDTMLHLNLLATAPKKQGLGYGSALVRVVTAQADEEKRATWLVSSNIANTGFYQSLGFEIKGEIVLGDDNPTWREPAVVMFVMVREYGENDARALH